MTKLFKKAKTKMSTEELTMFLSNNIERKRTYLYKSGYVKEDLTEIYPVLIQWFDSESMAIKHAKAHCLMFGEQLADYHIIQCRKTILGWTEIEGTEKHL